MSHKKKRKQRGKSRDRRPQSQTGQVERYWQQLLETLRPLPIATGYRAFEETGDPINVGSRGETLLCDFTIALRRYETAAERSEQRNGTTLCTMTVTGGTTGDVWLDLTLRKARTTERSLRWLLERMKPFTCRAILSLPAAHQSEEASLQFRVGLLVPSVGEARILQREYQRAARAGSPMLYELWPRGEDLRKLPPPFLDYMQVFRVRFAQLLDAAMPGQFGSEERRASALGRLSTLQDEEQRCIEELQRLEEECAPLREIITDSQQVDLWLAEDAHAHTVEELTVKVREFEYLLAMEPQRLPLFMDNRERCSPDALRRRLTGRLRRTRSRIAESALTLVRKKAELTQRIEDARRELAPFDRRYTALSRQCDRLLLERSALECYLR